MVCLPLDVQEPRYGSLKLFNENTFFKWVPTSKSRVTHDLDTDTTMHKIIGVVGNPLYLATPVSTALSKSYLSLINLVNSSMVLTNMKYNLVHEIINK